MSLDNRIYVVIRSTGEYSDRNEDCVVAFACEESAKRFVTDAAKQYDDAQALHPAPEYPEYPDECSEAEIETEYANYEAALANRTVAARSVAALDPDAIDSSGYDDRPYYFYRAVPLFTTFASAGEAGTATTPKSGVVHEHATGEAGDAQSSSEESA